MAACRKLLLPSVFSVLFCFSLLSANIEERNAQSPLGQGYVKGSIHDENDRQKMLEFEGLVSAVEADSSSKSRAHPSTILPRHQALIFDPPSLDFREHGVGMPNLETVRITNPSSTQALHLNSISGDSPVFHASFFKSKVVKAGESTTFDVVFLARVVGSVRNILYIQSSQGTFEYEVQGTGTPNPFRLRSLLGAKIPLNATYSPLITMYNPYSKPLQITEMYSSSGELHIELLTGQPEGAKALWELRPYETKPIARANFFGVSVSNHTSFVRVKTNHKSSPSVVLPVEVEVSDNAGLFLSRELLDFGVVKGGEIKVLPLYVLNTGQQQVHIKSISVLPENSAIEVEYMTTLLRPGSKYTKIALIKLHSDRVSSIEQTIGNIVIQAEDRILHQLEVPYEASVLMGSLSYEKSATLFRPGQPPFTPVAREIPLSNQFDSPVVVYDIKLPSKAQDYFIVSAFRDPFVLAPSSEWQHPFSVLFLPSSSDCFFNTTLRMATNATYFTIPLYCYDGRVKYSLEDPDEDALEFGVLSETDVVRKTFTLHNINPVKISIASYSVSPGLPFTTVNLQSIFSTNSTPPSNNNHLPQGRPYTLEPGHSARFVVTVKHPNTIGTYSGEVTVHTSFEKVLHVPVYFKTSESRLKVAPEVISLDSFPYARSKVVLSVKNLYRQVVSVTSVNPDLDDPRFYWEKSENGFSRLKPTEKAEIGSVVFDPLLGDSESVYLGMADSDDSLWTVDASSTRPMDPSREIRLYTSLWSSWKSLADDGLTFFNFSFVVSSDSGGEVKVPTTASLVWPDLVEDGDRIVTLTRTIVGNTSTHRLHITNPSQWPLLVQPVFLSHYTHPQTIIDSLSDRIDPRLRNLNFSLSSSSFTFIDPIDSSSSETALTSSVLPPLSNQFEITVAFSPKVDQELNMLLLLRNNLTVFDYVIVQGSGVQGEFSIDGIQPETEPLMFEFPNTVLENCQAGTAGDPLKLTKTFRMHNSGAAPIVLRVIGLEGGACEGRGFVVSNCNKDITIKPNRTKKIEITFTSDYTLTQVSNTLRIQTSSGNEILYPLLAILPHQLLAACFALQPRPEWERTLAWISVPFWLFVLLSIMATVFIQTKFGMRKSPVEYQNDNKGPVLQPSARQVFDLKDLTKNVQASLSKKIQDLEQKSINESSTSQPEEQPLRSESPSDRPKISNVKPIATPNTDLPIPATTQEPSNQMRHRTNVPSSKSETAHDSIPILHSKSAPTVLSTQRGKPLKTHVVATPVPSVSHAPRSSMDNHTGVREEVQSGVDTTEHVSPSQNKPKYTEKSTVEKSPTKSDPSPKTPTDTSTGVAQSSTPPNGRKSKAARKLSSKSLKSPQEPSPLPSAALKELERKASESSIISTNSDSTSTSTEKSEDAETPSSQVETVEVKFEKPPPPFTKEPNTGQTIHPPDTPDATEGHRFEQAIDSQKKDKEGVASPPMRVKGKKKLRQQQKKEEKARRKEKEREKERERDKEKETEKTEVAKRSSGSFEDSSSSNSTEQLEEDTPPSDECPAETEIVSEETSHLNERCDESGEKATSVEPEKHMHRDNSETNISLPPVAPAVPSTAIKTGRVKNTKQQIKDVVSDPFSRMPDRSTYTSKKESSKKQSMSLKTPPTISDKSTPSHDDNSEVQLEMNHDSSPKRPQTLPVIMTEPDNDPSDVYLDAGSAETDGVSHTLLNVDTNKNSSQSLPTSPHELAASLLSNNSAIMRRRQKSDKDKPGDSLEEEDDTIKAESEAKDLDELKSTFSPSPQKDGPYPSQFKPLSTLSLDAVPFYPSPNFQPTARPTSGITDPRNGTEYGPRVRANPPAFSPTPEDAYMGPYPEQHYLKRERLPSHPHVSKSMTPSPPLPYSSFPDGHHMPFGDYPPLDPNEPLSMDDPYGVSDDAQFLPGSRYGNRYRGHGMGDPQIVPKGGRSRPIGQSSTAFTDSYIANLHQQHLAQQHRASRERNPSGYPSGPGSLWDHSKPHRIKSPSVEEPTAQHKQYLKKRQYLLTLVKQERAALARAALTREQARRSAEALSSMSQPPQRGHSSMFGSDISPVGSSLGSRMWDDMEPLNEPSPMDDLSLSDAMLAHQIRQRQLLHDQAMMRPARSRTYSNESDLGGEFVTDLQGQLPSPSTVGAPGQQFSSRIDSSAKNLAPGRARSSGWPGDSQGSSSNWDNPNLWSMDSPFYGSTTPGTEESASASGTIGQRSLSDASNQPYTSTTYDLFENQSIWSLNTSDSSNLLSWAQLKSDQQESEGTE